MYSRAIMKNITRRKFAISAIVMATGLPSQKVVAEELQLSDFHMPMEHEPHQRTFMQWPVSVDVYGEKLLKRVQSSIATIAQAIARFEDVIVLVAPEHQAEARAALGKSIATWDIPTDDLWTRDSGPTFVRNRNGELAVSQIQFNGWGNKQPHDNDGLIAARVAERLGLPYLKSALIGEQGGLEHDGAGLVLAHASSWVNPNRDSGSAEDIGKKILSAVGGQKMIWAPGIIGADITDYHIDALARFVAPGKVLIQLPKEMDPEDPWSKSAFETLEILKTVTTVEGKPLEIVTLPEPTRIRSSDKNFVSSYVNYYVCNGAVIISEFGDKKADGEAREVLQTIYPNREIVMLNTDPIGESGGGIHCSTQQQPKTET